jgi:ribosomal protein S18 acetylase RimI-like enzyme
MKPQTPLEVTSAGDIIPQMQIRPMTPDDLILLNDIDATPAETHYLHVDRVGEGASTRFTIAARAARPDAAPVAPADIEFEAKRLLEGVFDGLALVAEHNGMIVASLIAILDAGSNLVNVVDVRVDREQRREGLASAMMFQLISFARDRDVRAIRACCTTRQFSVASLLTKLGFEVAGLDTHLVSNHDLVKEQATLFWYLALN